MTTLTVAAAAQAAIREHAEQAYPEECCGVLVGHDDALHGRYVAGAWPVPNVAQGRTRQFCMAPEALLGVEAQARQAAQDVVGIYHSHPDRAARPSAQDKRGALPYWSYIIVSCMGGRSTQARSFRLTRADGSFAEEKIGTPA